MGDVRTDAGRCVNCRMTRPGGPFGFHVGVFAGSSTKGGFGSVEITTRYRILGRWEGFVCGRCQARHLAVRYAAPLLIAAALSMVVAYGWPLGGGASPTVLQSLAAFVPVLMCVVGRGTRDAVHTALTQWRTRPAGCLGAIGYMAGLVLWAAGTYGALFPLFCAMDLEPGQHSLNHGTELFSVLPTWLTGIVGYCQLALLAAVLAVPAPVLESLAWRRSKRKLLADLGYRRLFGFNSARYSQLSKPPAEKSPPSPSHR